MATRAFLDATDLKMTATRQDGLALPGRGTGKGRRRESMAVGLWCDSAAPGGGESTGLPRRRI